MFKQHHCVLTMILLLGQIQFGWSQQYNADSLKNVLKTSKESKARLKALTQLSDYYDAVNSDSSVIYAQQLLKEAKTAGDRSSEGYAMGNIAQGHLRKGNKVQAIKSALEAKKLFEKIGDAGNLAHINNGIAEIYFESNPHLSYEYYTKARKLAEKVGNHRDHVVACKNLATYFKMSRKLDSANHYAVKALKIHDDHNVNFSRSILMLSLAHVKKAMDQIKEYDSIMVEAVNLAKRTNDPKLQEIELTYTHYLITKGKYDEAFAIADRIEKNTSIKKDPYARMDVLMALMTIYEHRRDFENAYKHQFTGYRIYDSLQFIGRHQEVANITFNETQKQQELKNAEAAYKNQVRWYAAFALFAVIIIFAIILIRNNKRQRKVNKQLEEQKHETETALQNLTLTQNQLVQSEKMASLGELTAGIAHEIQNPLNFVNNFAEVSEELLQELEEEVIAGNKDEAIALSTDLKNNLQKIHHHGKRADSIVKGMLQHSRSTSGQKDPTDINALVDEYLRLAYHGLRAKDKSFNATMHTEFSPDVPQVEIVPQDIGRVLLNLFTNAFYSVSEKKRKGSSEEYEPTVTITTNKVHDRIQITVSDNGMGIPQHVIDKIMQPFFTTKPTGEGTGLGLSMSYDIIKAHNGSITVESEEGQFARFTIVLPVSTKE